jgi:hypothetical protein
MEARKGVARIAKKIALDGVRFERGECARQTMAIAAQAAKGSFPSPFGSLKCYVFYGRLFGWWIFIPTRGERLMSPLWGFLLSAGFSGGLRLQLHHVAASRLWR